MTDNTDTAALRELLAKATPGDWTVEEPMDHELMIVEAGKEAYDWRTIGGLPWPDERGDIPRKQVRANAALIVALKNAAPALLDERDRLRAENADLTARLAAVHYCPSGYLIGEERPCCTDPKFCTQKAAHTIKGLRLRATTERDIGQKFRLAMPEELLDERAADIIACLTAKLADTTYNRVAGWIPLYTRPQAKAPDDLLEAVARAICCTTGAHWQDLSEVRRQGFRIYADAALSVTDTRLREAVEAAWREGWEACKLGTADPDAITDDVEADAWADSRARAFIEETGDGQ